MDAVRDRVTARRRIRRGMAMAAAVTLGLTLAGSETPWAQVLGRVIYMAAVEIKGGTQQDKEPYPQTPLPPGGGYIKTPPNAAGRWEVSAYQWSPATIVAQQGETVTLEIVGVNGDMHPATIPGLVESFTVKRGEITRVTLHGSQARAVPDHLHQAPAQHAGHPGRPAQVVPPLRALPAPVGLRPPGLFVLRPYPYDP